MAGTCSALAPAIDSESEDYDGAAAVAAVNELAAAVAPDATADYTLEDEETLATEDVTYTGKELAKAAKTFAEYNGEEPDPADYGIWVPGIPVLVGSLLESMNCGEVLSGLILDGIIAGVGAVLGFVPRCWCCSCSWHSWRNAATWRVSPLLWTVSSAALA